MTCVFLLLFSAFICLISLIDIFLSEYIDDALDKVSLYKSPAFLLKIPLLLIKLACIVSYKMLIHDVNYESFFTSVFFLPILIYLVQNIPKWYEIYS